MGNSPTPSEPLSCGLGDVQFSVASDDNSEFWLSPNESPAGAQLVAFVGKVTPQQDSSFPHCSMVHCLSLGFHIFVSLLKEFYCCSSPIDQFVYPCNNDTLF